MRGLRGRGVAAGQLSLFDLQPPSPDPPVGSPDVPAPRDGGGRDGNGRAGRRYARTVVADVRVRRREVLHARALASYDESPAATLAEVDRAVDVDRAAPESREAIATDWVAALGWLIDPAAGMHPLLEADAVRVMSMDIDLSDRGEDWCRLQWTVLAELRDVPALRHAALDACPAKDVKGRAAIRRGAGEAWRWASDPYAPVRHLPGIDWTPVEATVEHRPVRTARGR